MRRSDLEDSARESRPSVLLLCKRSVSCLNHLPKAVFLLFGWIWTFISSVIPDTSPGPEYLKLKDIFDMPQDIRVALSNTQASFKPLLVLNLGVNYRLGSSQQQLLQSFIEEAPRLKDRYNFYLASPKTPTFTSKLINQLAGYPPISHLATLVCILPFAMNHGIGYQGHSYLSDLMEPISYIPFDEQRRMLREILSAQPPSINDVPGISMTSGPATVLYSALIKAFSISLTHACQPLDLVNVLLDWADFVDQLTAPVICIKDEQQKQLEESRRLRQAQDEEYRRVLAEDRERQQKKEEEARRQRALAEAEQAEKARREAEEKERQILAQKMISLARTQRLEAHMNSLMELSIRINGLKLRCCCDEDVDIQSVETAIKNLDLLLGSNDIEDPLLLVGKAKDGVIPAMVVEGGYRWHRKLLPFSEEYGLVSSLPSHQLIRTESLVKNGINSKSSMLWGKVATPPQR